MALLISVSFLSASRPKSIATLYLYLKTYITNHYIQTAFCVGNQTWPAIPGSHLPLGKIMWPVSLYQPPGSSHQHTYPTQPPPSPNPPHSPLALVASVVDKQQVNRSSPKWQQVHSQQTTSTTSSCLTHCVRTVVFHNSHTEESIQAAQNTINI